VGTRREQGWSSKCGQIAGREEGKEIAEERKSGKYMDEAEERKSGKYMDEAEERRGEEEGKHMRRCSYWHSYAR
jgi:hypothetical protein